MHRAPDFSSVITRLETAFASPLPGLSAHAILAPRSPRQWPAGFDQRTIRHASGLLLVFPLDDRAHLLLTVRAEGLERHGGQVSMPGGAREPGETAVHAALREAHEETGLSVGPVRVLGALTPVDIPVSGFRLHPIVGAIDHRPSLTPAAGEVARILDVPLDALFDHSTLRTIERLRDGRTLVLPAFSVCGVEIWGATAMVLSEFLTLLGWQAPKLS